MLDSWLWRRQRRIEQAAAFWPATFFALPGLLFASYVYPVTLSTVDGFALSGHGAAVGAGLGAGLAFSLRGFWSEARSEWWGFVLCLLLGGGAAAIHLNAEQPEAERRSVASRVVGEWDSHGRRSEPLLRRLSLRSVMVEWQGLPLRVVADRDLVLPVDSAVVLSVYDGRFGFPVIERMQPVEARER